MIEYLLVAGTGLLGSAHCLGMCGPFALAIGSRTSWRENLARQALYTVGRVFTYSVLGALVGFGGLRLSEGVALRATAILALLAGGLLLGFGLHHLGLWKTSGTKKPGSCLATAWFGPLLRGRTRQGVFLAGLFTGFLPCGLVYSVLALAASTASVPGGALMMALFGAGTAPVMIATGLGGGLLSVSFRTRAYRFAAVCMLLAGVVSIARGVSCYAQHPEDAGRCPLCAEKR